MWRSVHRLRTKSMIKGKTSNAQPLGKTQESLRVRLIVWGKQQPAPSFVDSCRVSRTGFTNLEPQYLEKPSILGLSGRATSDALTAICGTAQYTNSAHSRVSTQTRNQHRSGNPLQRLAFASAPIRESRNTDS